MTSDLAVLSWPDSEYQAQIAAWSRQRISPLAFAILRCDHHQGQMHGTVKWDSLSVGSEWLLELWRCLSGHDAGKEQKLTPNRVSMTMSSASPQVGSNTSIDGAASSCNSYSGLSPWVAG